MKKYFLLFLCVLIYSGIFAQEEVNKFPYKNSIKLSVLEPINNSAMLNYERHLVSKFNLLLIGGIHYTDHELFSNHDETLNYINIGYLSELQLRCYLYSKQVLSNKWKRFFVAPFGFYRNYRINDFSNKNQQTLDKRNYTISSYGGGGLLGYYLEVDAFSFELFFGIGMKYCITDMDEEVASHFQETIEQPAWKGSFPKFGLNIGFNF